jgi:hypothetical protein
MLLHLLGIKVSFKRTVTYYILIRNGKIKKIQENGIFSFWKIKLVARSTHKSRSKSLTSCYTAYNRKIIMLKPCKIAAKATKAVAVCEIFQLTPVTPIRCCLVQHS